MNALTIIILIFSVLGGIDYITGSRFGLGKEFERGFRLLGTFVLSMVGMIVIAPLIATVLRPFFDVVYSALHIDPSIVPASLFANDMGGASLAAEVAKDSKIGLFNALVVSSMMGCTVSFTIPFALGTVKKDQHRILLLGLLAGIVTIPIGCFASGIMCKIPIGELLKDLLPLIVFSGIIAFGLFKFPDTCVKIFGVFAGFIRIILAVGLVFGIVNFLCKQEIIPGIDKIENAAFTCFNIAVVMSGTFPMMYVVTKLLKKPLDIFGEKIGINSTAAVGFLASLVTSVTTFGTMEEMDDKGAMMNSAFAVSAAFMFAAHLAYTMTFDSSMIPAVMTGKAISGVTAVVLAFFLYKKSEKVS